MLQPMELLTLARTCVEMKGPVGVAAIGSSRLAIWTVTVRRPEARWVPDESGPDCLTSLISTLARAVTGPLALLAALEPLVPFAFFVATLAAIVHEGTVVEEA